MDQLKVVIIGAASPQWGYILSRDFIVKLSDEAICSLEDINERNLELQTELARKVALKINLFLRYGVLPYSGDRHNAEFVNDDTDKGADRECPTARFSSTW
jgi:ribosomal protein S13